MTNKTMRSYSSQFLSSSLHHALLPHSPGFKPQAKPKFTICEFAKVEQDKIWLSSNE